MRTRRLSLSRQAGPSPGRGIALFGLVLAADPGFGERSARPREALLVPPGKGGDGDAVAGGVNEPAAAQVDPGVVDLSGLGSRAGGSPEKNVAGLQPSKRDALRCRHLSAHRKRGAALERACERRSAGVDLELVHAPHKSGAVEAARRLDAERRFGFLARTAPNVREADEVHGCLEDLRLPGGQSRQLECLRELLDPLGLPAAEAEDLCRRIGGFGARCGLAWQQLERIELRRVVGAKSKETRNGFGPETARRDETGRAGCGGEL